MVVYSCCSGASAANYLGMCELQVYLSLVVLFLLCRVGSLIGSEGCGKQVFQHISQMVAVFTMIRFFIHIPGFFECLFYIIAVPCVYEKMKKAYDDYVEAPTCYQKQYVYYIYSVLIPLGVLIGFVEKCKKCFIANALIIDLLALGWAIRWKPIFMDWFAAKVDVGDEEFEYGDVTIKKIRWFEGAITLFCSARNLGMMIYCTGLFTAKKSKGFGFF